MTRPFFSKERISHFEIFDRHAGELIFPQHLLVLTIHHLETTIDKIKERMSMGDAIEFQVMSGHI